MRLLWSEAVEVAVPLPAGPEVRGQKPHRFPARTPQAGEHPVFRARPAPRLRAADSDDLWNAVDKPAQILQMRLPRPLRDPPPGGNGSTRQARSAHRAVARNLGERAGAQYEPSSQRPDATPGASGEALPGSGSPHRRAGQGGPWVDPRVPGPLVRSGDPGSTRACPQPNPR